MANVQNAESDKIAAEAAKEIAETTFFAGTNPRWQQEQLEKKIYAALSQSLAARDKEIEKAIKELRRQAVISNYGCCSRAMDARADELEAALLKGKAI